MFTRKHLFSFMGTKLTLKLKPETAFAYNEAQRELFAAQARYTEMHGSSWNPLTDAIELRWTEKQRSAFDKVGVLVNKALEDPSMVIHEDDMTSDYLMLIK